MAAAAVFPDGFPQSIPFSFSLKSEGAFPSLSTIRPMTAFLFRKSTASIQRVPFPVSGRV
jgi:hypothetical protein